MFRFEARKNAARDTHLPAAQDRSSDRRNVLRFIGRKGDGFVRIQVETNSGLYPSRNHPLAGIRISLRSIAFSLR